MSPRGKLLDDSAGRQALRDLRNAWSEALFVGRIAGNGHRFRVDGAVRDRRGPGVTDAYTGIPTQLSRTLATLYCVRVSWVSSSILPSA